MKSALELVLLGRTTLSGFWYLRPHSAVKMHKTRYQVQDFATSRAIATHLSPPGIGLFVAFLHLIPASQVCSQLPAACLRAHARCLTEGVVPGGFGLVLGRFGRSRNAIRVSARWPVCIIMHTRGVPGSTEGLNLGVSWVGWIPEGPHPTSLPPPHLLLVSFAASVASPACPGCCSVGFNSSPL